MSDRLLGQDEIDALLSKNLLEESETVDDPVEALRSEEIDALGEIGNISMGSAATTLSQILNRKVSITSPVVKVVARDQLLESFGIPHLLIEVRYTKGLEGTSLLIMQIRDAAILADLMMGGDGANPSSELTDLEVSATSEAMNQMIGAASTSMAALFRRTVIIGPPVPKIVTTRDLEGQPPLEHEQLAVTYFNLLVEGLIDNTMLQILDLDTARAEAALLWHDVESIKDGQPEAAPEVSVSPPAPARATTAPDPLPPAPPDPPVRPPQRVAPETGLREGPSRAVTGPAVGGVEQGRLDVLLDIPLKVSVILGRSRQPVKDVLNMTPGAVMGLEMALDEPVEVLLNGTLVAKGEVVVVDENFGVRITSILSPMERLQNLRR